MADITYHTPMKKLSDATEYNGVIYTAGQVSEDLTLNMKGQTADVLRQIDTLLAKCGSNKSRILSATVYVTDMRNRLPWANCSREAFAGVTVPAQTLVGISQLAFPEMILEIDVIAVAHE